MNPRRPFFRVGLRAVADDANQFPLVGVIVDGPSEEEAVEPALELLRRWNVPHETHVASAHRSPRTVLDWAAQAVDRGFEVIIATAGRSAHLPGLVASQTLLPVIGLPLSSVPLSGGDALGTMTQSPSGFPIAVVGIDHVENAAVLALQVLARSDARWNAQLEEYRGSTADEEGEAGEESENREAGFISRPHTQAPEIRVEEEPGDGEEDGEEDEVDEEAADDADLLVRPIDLSRPLTPAAGAKSIVTEQARPEPQSRERARPVAGGSRARHRGRIPIESDLLPIEIAEMAVECLLEGGIVALPTDTVYGLAVDASNTDAVQALYALKGRDPERAIAVFIDSQRLLASLVRNLTIDVRRMLEAFWPGPLTVVFERRPGEFGHLSTGPTLGVRLPDHSIPLTLMQELSRPIACTSANPSGMPAATSADQVAKFFGRKVHMILDVGVLPSRAVSTVVDVTQVPFRILREGAVTREQIAAVVGDMLKPEEEEE